MEILRFRPAPGLFGGRPAALLLSLALAAGTKAGLAGALLGTAGCAGPQQLPPAPPPPPGPPPEAAQMGHPALDSLYRAGRLAVLGERVTRNAATAGTDVKDILGLLAAAQGRVGEGLDLLSAAAAVNPPTNPAASAGIRCLALDMALIAFYQLADTAAVIQALDRMDGASGACSGEVPQMTAAALRARTLAVGPAGDRPLFSVSGPDSEQAVVLEPNAANAGYLVARVSFDRQHSGHFLLSTGSADVVVDAVLARDLGLVIDEQRQMPVRDVPGLGAATGDHFVGLPTALLPKAQLGLFTLRDVPALLADFSELRGKFKRLSPDIDLQGVLPIQRLVRQGSFRILKHGSALRLRLSDDNAGPCRQQHPYVTPLYHIGGALFADAGLGPARIDQQGDLLWRLEVAQRHSLVRRNILRYQGGDLSLEPAEAANNDATRPAITEPEAPEVKERIVQALLRLGPAEVHLHHVPLLPAEATVLHQPAHYGTLGSDIPLEFDLMADLGDGHLYLSPPDRVACEG